MTFPPKATLLLLIALLLSLCACERQQEEKIFTIGVINFSPAADPAYEGFHQGMADLGYAEGSIRYLYRGHISDKQQLTAEGKRLMENKVDLIFSMTTPASLVSQKVTANTSVPVVFGPVSNPVKSGLVASLKQPGGNLTGVTFSQQEPKRLEFLKMLKPSIKHVCFPYNSRDKSPVLNLERLQEVARKMEIELIPIPLHNSREISTFIENYPGGFDAIYLPTDSLMATHTSDFVEIAISHKLPLSTPQREGVVAGGLVSYGFSTFEVGRQAARLADQILHGISPADLPVEVSEFVASINMSTARKIDIHIANSILRQAVVIRE
jgi:putative tryptophan/tyrosine transport system substrate-binding protein